MRLMIIGLALSALAVSLSSNREVVIGRGRDNSRGLIASDTLRVVPNDNRRPGGHLRDGILNLRLVAVPALWSPEGMRGPAVPVYAFAEEGGAPRVPGPLIRVPVGTEIRAAIRNHLPAPLRIYGFQDRPGTSADSIDLAPGESREVRMRAGAPGTYLYWARTSRDTFAIGQFEDGQLAGAIVVDSAPNAGQVKRDDRVFVVGLWQAHPFPTGTPVELREETLVFNGLAWPHTERLSHTVGDTIHWRVINATRRGHPMHLHGFYYRVDARGSAVYDTLYTSAEQRLAVTERLLPLTTMSMTWSPHTPGNWLFHCHLVEHIAGRMNLASRRKTMSADGSHQNHALEAMSGLVLGINVRPRPGQPLPHAEPARRTLRLFVTETPRVFDDASAYSYILQDGAREPASDSMRVPGSTIVLTRGEPTAIVVLNRAQTPVTVHWHGIELESYFDGVGGWSGDLRQIAPSVAPGDSFIVRLTPQRAGTFIYHTHQDEVRQLGAGLYGPLIVVEPGQTPDTLTDRILLMGTSGPFPRSPANLNGQTSPAPIEFFIGTTYHLRFIAIAANENKLVTLRADTALQRWRAIAKDGATLPPQQATVRPARVQFGPGETWDFEYTPNDSGERTLQIVTSGRGLPATVMRVPVHVRPKSR